jgi:hypothetical protein
MLGLSQHSRQILLDRIEGVKARIDYLRVRIDASDQKAQTEIAGCEKQLSLLRSLLREFSTADRNSD